MFPVTFMNRFVAKMLACIVLLMVAQISADVTVTTIAGSGIPGFVNGNGTDAQFNNPLGLAFGQDGNLYVADGGNSAIRMITKDGMVSTYANLNILTSNFQLQTHIRPTGIVFDSSGKLYISDASNHAIWVVAADRKSATLFAGNLSSGKADGEGMAAQFSFIDGMAFDSKVNLYVADSGNNLVRMVNSIGYVSTFAGSGQNASTEGTGTGASFKFPAGVVIDSSDNVYVSEHYGHQLRKITPYGYSSFYAGSGVAGDTDGIGNKASFNGPSNLAIDPRSGNIYVAELTGNFIRMITLNGNVTTVAGTGFPTSVDGDGAKATFNSPVGLAFGPDGALYVSEFEGNKIRKIASVTSTDTPNTSTNMTSTNTTSTNSSTPTIIVDPPLPGITVGVGVVAAVVVVGAIGIGAFLYIRNRKPKETFVPPPPERISINYMDAGKSIHTQN